MVRRVRKDTWKTKKWYKIVVPPLFEEKEVGETLASTPDLLRGRKVEVTLKDITGDIKQSKTKLLFRINNVAGTTARTECIGFELSRSYIRSITRRRISMVNPICDVTTKDGAKFRVKALFISGRRMKSSLKHVIRLEAMNMFQEYAGKITAEEFINKLVNEEIQNEMKQKLHKIYPVRRVEVNKLELLVPPQK